jgi:valyl-tRNA synthetase
MPFITEALWKETAAREKHLIVTPWPEAAAFARNEKAAAEVNWLIGLISAIRSARQEMNVPAGAKIPMAAVAAGPEISLRIDLYRDLIARLARLDPVGVAPAAPKGAVQVVHEGGVYALPLAGVIDVAAEKARLAKEIDKCVKEIDAIDRKMSNPDFVERAPAEIVEENRERRAAFGERREKLSAALAQISES